MGKGLKELKKRFEIELDFFGGHSVTADFASFHLRIFLKSRKKEYRGFVYLNTRASALNKFRHFSIALKRNSLGRLQGEPFDPYGKLEYDFVSLSYMMATLNFRIKVYEKSLDNKRLKNSV